MIDIITNPITLLCLTITFLLVSFLFFYFKRTISTLERAQMEQARVLQSFISNMEMSRSNIPYQQVGQEQPVTNNMGFQNGSGIVSGNELIPVSDGECSSDSDESSDDESSDDEDEDDESSNDERININVVEDDMTISSDNAISPNDIIELDSHKSNSDGEEIVKVIHLDNNSNLEDLVDNSIQHLEEIINDSDENDSDSDDNSSDSDDNEVGNVHNENNLSDSVLPTIDYNSLNVKTLREMVSERALATEGDKLKKKDLIKLLESDKK